MSNERKLIRKTCKKKSKILCMSRKFDYSIDIFDFLYSVNIFCLKYSVIRIG